MLDIKRIPIPALIGLILTALFLFAAMFAPFIAPYGLGEIVGSVWEPSSSQFWLGTDNLGRDLLSRMIYGARTTIFIAVLATALSFLAWYIFAPQCVATLGVVRRETNSLKWTWIMIGYMFGLAYLASLVTYHVAVALGGG